MTKALLPFLLFLSALKGFSQYTHDSIKVKDGFLHFYIKGEGKPVVLLQGGPGFSNYYMRGIADSLQGYRCILIDYEGTGKSKTRTPDTSWVGPDKVIENIERVRQHLKIQSWDVIGHSYGTHFGLYYSINYPNRVKRIILIGSIGTNNLFQKYSNDNAMVRLSAEDMQQIGAIDADTLLSPVEKDFKLERIFLKSYFFDKSKIDPYLSSVPALEKPDYFSNAFFNAYWESPSFFKWDISKKAYALTQPVRILQGRQDFVNDGTQEIMNLRMKNSKITYIERCGHFPWVERPAVFFPMLREALIK